MYWAQHFIDGSNNCDVTDVHGRNGADGTDIADFDGDGDLDVVSGWEESADLFLYLNPKNASSMGAAGDVTQPWTVVIDPRGGRTVSNIEEGVFADLTDDPTYGKWDSVISATELDKRDMQVHALIDRSHATDPASWVGNELPGGGELFLHAREGNIDPGDCRDIVGGSRTGTDSNNVNFDGSLHWWRCPAGWEPGKPLDLSGWEFFKIGPAYWIMTIVLADMDGDHDLDVLFSDRQKIAWAENQVSSGVEQNWPIHTIASGHDYREVAYVDLDRDGRKDVVATTNDEAASNVAARWYRGNANGTWTEYVIHVEGGLPYGKDSLDNQISKGIAVDDVDFDNRMDIAITARGGTHGGAPRGHGVFLLSWKPGLGTPCGPCYDGDWTLTLVAPSFPEMKYDNVQLVDLDLDGDLDVLSSEENAAGDKGLGVVWYENPYFPACGNGLRNAGEDCDFGAQNGSLGICCNRACRFTVNGSPCRLVAGPCDVAETCTGSSPFCPQDGFRSNTTECRPAAGVCDLAETCTGLSAQCTNDQFRPSSTVCRPATGTCDIEEHCTGSQADCPPDRVVPGPPLTVVFCRPVAGPCDYPLGEFCDGSSPQCPPDQVLPRGIVCRPPVGSCDIAESCDGTQSACPPDQVVPGPTEPPYVPTVCRLPAGACDFPLPEVCDGTSGQCPPDRLLPAGVVCRPSTAVCDAAESCTGTEARCPTDTGVEDADTDGVCDTADNCLDVTQACSGGTCAPSGATCVTGADCQADRDGDGLGDACDPCTQDVPPIMMDKARLSLFHLDTSPGDDGLKLKGQMAVPTTPALDPATKGVRLLLTDAPGGRVLDAIIPGGPGWSTSASGTTWKYTDKAGSIAGITRVTAKDLSSKVPGLVKFKIGGASGNYAVSQATIPVSATLVLEGPIGVNNQCGDARFPGPKPAPSCAFNASGGTLKCK